MRDTSGPRPDQDELGVAHVRIEHVGPAAQLLGRREDLAIEGGERLSGEHQDGRGFTALDGDLPRDACLVGVARPQHGESGDGPQARELLHRLVGRSVFADADAVVGIHPDRRSFAMADSRIGGRM